MESALSRARNDVGQQRPDGIYAGEQEDRQDETDGFKDPVGTDGTAGEKRNERLDAPDGHERRWLHAIRSQAVDRLVIPISRSARTVAPSWNSIDSRVMTIII